MPTGSGKTAVLMALPFLLEARRVLVVTPSRLVREQIADDFAELTVLRRLGVFDEDVPQPKVRAVSGRISSANDWNELAEVDLVVGTPSSLSPSIAGVPEPPEELFDLVLVDEAHHTAAASWRALMDAFPHARRVLFTATPFRRDRREIVGSFVYTYELADAWRDGTFGEVRYAPVDPEKGQDSDDAIADAASAQLVADQKAGLDHRLLVRTSSQSRARELLDLYRGKGLDVDLILGEHGLRHVRRAIRRLRDGELQGIVCVDMFGEGFDLPQLKVAALHAPHRSLAVTLQFIGRFARTTGEKLGKAKFFAVATDMQVERAALYEQGAAWDLLIPNLSAARVRRERDVKEVLATFAELPARVEDGDDEAPPREVAIPPVVVRDAADVSLHSLRPYHHVKVFRAPAGVDVARAIEFPVGLDVVMQMVSTKDNAAIYVTRESARPEWATTNHFDGVEHDLFVLVHDPRTKLVFICSSRRTDAIYQHLAKKLAPPGEQPLRGVPAPVLNKALLDLDDPIFFNVGLANAVAANQSESYRVLMGSSAHDAIGRADARSYRRGHWFCGANSGGERITLGLSSSSKLWSNTTDTIPVLVRWCREIGKKLVDRRTPTTSCNLDLLAMGEEATTIPDEILFADWPADFFDRQRVVEYVGNGGGLVQEQLLAMDLEVRYADRDSIRFAIVDDDCAECEYVFALTGQRMVEPVVAGVDLTVISGRARIPLSTVLSEHQPRFYTTTYGCLDGWVWHAPRPVGERSFAAEQFVSWNWAGLGIDPKNECGTSTTAGLSIHDGLERELLKGAADILYYDHGSGEMADYVEVYPAADGQDGDTIVRFYHCKGTKIKTAGARVGDAYEVCGQAAKSMTWARRDALLAAMKRRLSRKRPSRFVRGSQAEAETLLGPGRRVVLEIVIVQPGFSKAKLDGDLGLLLAAADEYLATGPCKRLIVIGSA